MVRGKANILLAVGGLLVCAAVRVGAQVPDSMPQRGVYPNGAYAFDKLEAINTAMEYSLTQSPSHPYH